MSAVPTTPDVPSSGQAFVAEAARLAAASRPDPRAGDSAAAALLAEARRHVYHWPEDFGGFAAEVVVHDGRDTWRGSLELRSSRDYALDLRAPAGAPAHAWARYHLEEMVSHREAPAQSGIASRAPVALGDDDPIYGRRVDFIGDAMGSHYRIRDRRITWIARGYRGTRFVIRIDAHAEIGGRFAATAYAAFYRDAGTSLLTKVETYHDAFAPVGDGGVFLPVARRVTEAGPEGELTRELRLENPARR